MTSCWQGNVADRCTFEDLVTKLGDMLEKSVQQVGGGGGLGMDGWEEGENVFFNS